MMGVRIILVSKDRAADAVWQVVVRTTAGRQTVVSTEV